MAKRPRLPSWDEMNPKAPLPTSNNPNVPTYDDVMFGRLIQARQGREQDSEAQSGWDVAIPKDVENVGTELTTAPTTNPKKPRALTIGYNPNTNTLVVVFRDNTWWQYNNVPVDMWLGLRNSASTGKYLREEGLDTWPDMGPADMNSLSESVKAQLSESAQSANDIQNSNTVLEKALMGRESLRSFTAEELFKDYL
jgi:hypothetical protein